MRPFLLKLRLIYLPFLGMAAGIILGYSLLNGWLTIGTSAIPLKEPVTDIWIPLILPFIVLAIWLRPAIKLLNLKTRRRSDLPFLYLLIAGLAIGIPTILLQGYLRTAMGKLTPLPSISRIRDNKLTRYYTAKEFYIDTSLASFNNTAIVSGKNNQYLDFSIYIACPIFDRKPPTPSGNALPQAWACVKYTHQVSNRLDASERKEKWQTFVLATLEDFGHKDLNSLLYLDRIGNTEDRDNYEKAIGKNTYISTIPGPLLILEPRFTAFEARNGHALPWVFGSFAIGAVIWLIMLAIPKLNTSVLEGDENALTLKKTPAGNELKEMVSLLMPRQGYAATPLIIDLNILVFALMVFAGKGFINFQSADLLAWGANYRPRTAGEGSGGVC